MNYDKNAELGTKIAQILDQSASNVGSRTEKRLLDIRKLALTNYKQQPMPAWALVSANNGRLGQLLAPLGYKASFWTALAVIVTTVVFLNARHTVDSSRIAEIAEIDMGLLTSELPIDAYLDKGLDSWLKQQEP